MREVKMNQNNRNRKDSSGNFRSGGKRFGGSYRKNSFNNSPRDMHKATCADCKKECEVPFKPTEGKPVYCRDCFSKHRKY